MRSPDFSRSDLFLFTFLTALCAFILGVWASDIFLSATGSGAAWTGIVGAAVGGTITFMATTYHERKRRDRELADLRASIYAEVADRVARCVSDYLHPWRNLERVKAGKLKPAEWVRKFRPADPVVYPGIAAKLGLFGPNALLALSHFYFRLDALSRAIDALADLCEREGALASLDRGDRARLKLIAGRMASCFEPALRVLETLDVPGAEAFDHEAAREYHHLRSSGDTLRAALKKFARIEAVQADAQASQAADDI